jgi:hypothetical protein
VCALPSSYRHDLDQAVAQHDLYGIAVNTAYLCAMTAGRTLASRNHDIDQLAVMATGACFDEVRAALDAEVSRVNGDPSTIQVQDRYGLQIQTDDEVRSGMLWLIYQSARFEIETSRTWECWRLTQNEE